MGAPVFEPILADLEGDDATAGVCDQEDAPEEIATSTSKLRFFWVGFAAAAALAALVLVGGYATQHLASVAPTEATNLAIVTEGSKQIHVDGDRWRTRKALAPYQKLHGNTLCSSGTEITSASDCKAAAIALGRGDDFKGTWTHSHSPPGCFAEKDDYLDEYVYFNLDAKGAPSQWSSPICKAAKQHRYDKSAYQMGKTNTLCSTGTQITNASVCKGAAIALGRDSDAFTTKTSEFYPAGCYEFHYHEYDEYDLFYNHYTEGKGEPDADSRPICQASSKGRRLQEVNKKSDMAAWD